MNKLTIERMREMAPSISTPVASPNASDRYSHFNTENALSVLESAGWYPVSVNEKQCRNTNLQAFTKHLIRLRHDELPTITGDNVPELIIINSHDTKCSLKVMLGFYRMACANGIIIGNDVFKGRVIHTVGNEAAMSELIKHAESKLVDAAQLVYNMSMKKLSQAQINELCNKALMARWDKLSNVPKNVDANELVTLRRWEDNTTDLWTVFNRIQETLVRGGVRGVRRVKAIDTEVKVNTKLFSLATEYLNAA